MNQRKYTHVESILSNTSGTGVNFAVRIHGDNTSILAVDRKQNNDQIKFVIRFEDLGFSVSTYITKSRGGDLVAFASDLYEQDSKEEYYKVVLILMKRELEEENESIGKCIERFEAGKHSYPVDSSNVHMYRAGIETRKKAIASIDVTEADLIGYKEYCLASIE